MEKINVPHADRVVGFPKEVRAENVYVKTVENAFKKLHENNESIFIEGFEIEKTEIDKNIIQLIEKESLEFFQKYGRQKEIPMPLEKIHLLKEGGTFEYTKGEKEIGAHSGKYGSIIVDRCPSNLEFSLRLFHEIVHLKSYTVLQITKADGDKRKLVDYRGGFSVTTRDGRENYFEDIDEGLTSEIERIFYEKIKNNEIFKKESKEEIVFSRENDWTNINKLIDFLFEKNKEKFSDRSEVLDLFLKAKVNGNLLEVGKLVESTFGKGSFRWLGKNGMREFLKGIKNKA